MIVTALLTLMTMLVCGTPPAGFTSETAQKGDFKERDEFSQTYQLAPGAHVEVSSIRGHVTITNADTATAEVKIIRTARSLADLEHHKIEVQQTANGLVVRGVQEPGNRGQNIRVNHEVILKLPRSIDLSVNSVSGSLEAGDINGQLDVRSISGSVNIGNVGGKLQLNSVSGSLEVGNVGADARLTSISGNVRLGQVNGLLDVTSVSGGVSATLLSLSPPGIQIKSVSGSIDLGFKGDVNADLKADDISGQVHIDMPNVTRETVENSAHVRARIGAGGTPITIFSVSGNIRLSRS